MEHPTHFEPSKFPPNKNKAYSESYYLSDKRITVKVNKIKVTRVKLIASFSTARVTVALTKLSKCQTCPSNLLLQW